jgi:hypothetical protein
MAKRITPGRARRSTKALRRSTAELQRNRTDIQIGPNMRKSGGVRNMVIGITIGTVLFFVVSWLIVNIQHLHH